MVKTTTTTSLIHFDARVNVVIEEERREEANGRRDYGHGETDEGHVDEVDHVGDVHIWLQLGKV